MKLKSLIFALFLTLGMASSYANVSNNNVVTNKIETELYNNFEVKEVINITISEEDCTWYRITTTTTV